MTAPDAVSPIPHLLRPAEVAAVLRISRSSVQRLVESGALPSLRFGGIVRIRESDLVRFVEEHSRGREHA